MILGRLRKNISKNIRKRSGGRLVMACLAAVCMMAVLTSCHGKKALPAFEVPGSLDESAQIELTFWAKNDTNKTQTAVYNKAISEFHELYPNITVTMRLYNDYGRIYNDVITNISTQTTPNICITYPDHIATYLTGPNTVVPLDELIADEKYGLGGSEVKFDAPTREEMVDKYMEECKIGGVQYALPFMRSTECCYINKDMVESLGYELPDVLTWDFVWEVSEAAMARNADGTYKVNGQNVLIPFIYKSTDNMMIQYLKQAGGEYSTESGEIKIFNDTTDGFLFDIAEHAKTGCFSTFKISSYPGNFLNAGQCIFAIDSTAGATWMGTKATHMDIARDQVVDFDLQVRPIPQTDPDNPVMISQGPSVCIFNRKDPQEVLASWLFVQYLMTNDIQMGYAETEGYTPVTEKARNSAEYLNYLSRSGEDNDLYYRVKIEATQLLIDNTDNTFITPVFNGSASLRDAAGQLIENVVKSVRRKETIDADYMDDLHRDITSLYRLNQIRYTGNTNSAVSVSTSASEDGASNIAADPQ